jgi:hypothetical protein
MKFYQLQAIEKEIDSLLEQPDGLVYLKKSNYAFARTLVSLEALVMEIRSNSIPQNDIKGGNIKTPREKLWALNDLILKHEENIAAMTTSKTDIISRDNTAIPEGCLVFEALETQERLEDDALRQLQELYGNEENPLTREIGITDEKHSGASDLHFLFYSKKTPIYIGYVLDKLRELRYNHLLQFILLHYRAIQSSLGAPDSDMEACSLTFVKYRKGRGLIAHIDGIKDFRDTFGPIFTIAMGEGLKRLDLLPVATNEGENLPPVRLFTKQFEITMLQGCARAAYAHSVPFGIESDQDQYTIAFKFPAIRGGDQGPRYHCKKLGEHIPSIVMQTGTVKL